MDTSAYISAIVSSLLERDVERLQETRESLIEENYKLGGPREGFLFGGTFHTLLAPKAAAAAPKRLLAPELHARCQEYLTELRTVNQEVERIRSGLIILLRGCKTEQDVRDALPDMVLNAVPELVQLPRTREEGYTLKSNPLLHHDYQRTQDLLLFYAANRMLY